MVRKAHLYVYVHRSFSNRLATCFPIPALALALDPAYRQLVEEFAANRGNFETEFAHAWYLYISVDQHTVFTARYL